MRAKPRPDASPSDAAVVAKAASKAADRLGINNKTFARIIGVSEASITRMRKGEFPLDPRQKPFELALLFVRLYRSLDAVVGGDEAVARRWLVNGNTALKAPPLDLIQTVAGLADVIQYLDARRAVV